MLQARSRTVSRTMSPRFSRRNLVAAVAISAVAASACTTTKDADAESARSTETTLETSTSAVQGSPSSIDSGFPAGWEPPALDWSDCDSGSGGDMQCTTLVVPLDWSEPDGARIELALARLPAHGDRIGSLLTNPGGPGASGIEYLGWSPVSQELADRFDLVSWDPRGVGESTAVSCEDNVGDFLAQDPSPDDPVEQASIEDAAAAVSQECADNAGDLLDHVDTAEVARDMEAIRLALGAEPLNYLGFSYGTQIGLLYAQMFGSEIRAMALDGVVDPSLALEDFLLGQVAAFDAAFDENTASCADAGAEACGVADLAAAYDEVAARVEEGDLPGGPDGVGPAEVAVAATYAAYLSDGWAVLGPALDDALHGDGSALWDLASGYYDFGGYGSYAAVVCTDSTHPEGPVQYRDFTNRATEMSPRFGPTIANEMLPCATWAATPQGEPRAVTAPEAPDILVIGNTGDPATPLANAEAVADSLDSGRLVVVDIDGHTAYGSDECATRMIDDYLIELALPDEGTTC